MVPKAITLTLVNHAKENLQRELLQELYKPEVLDELLKESEFVVTRRKEVVTMLQALNKAEECVPPVRCIPVAPGMLLTLFIGSWRACERTRLWREVSGRSAWTDDFGAFLLHSVLYHTLLYTLLAYTRRVFLVALGRSSDIHPHRSRPTEWVKSEASVVYRLYRADLRCTSQSEFVYWHTDCSYGHMCMIKSHGTVRDKWG